MEEDWTQRGKNGAKEDQNEQNWQKEQKRSKIRAEREQVLREFSFLIKMKEDWGRKRAKSEQ